MFRFARNTIVLAAILLSLAAFGSGQVHKAVSGAGWQWPAHTDGITYIPVCWENPAGWATETTLVKNKITSTWQKVANLNFYGWGACDPSSKGIRILITDTRSNSRVGKFMDGIKNAMELNFTFKNFSPSCQAENRRLACITTVALHEFGHAIGLIHEQDRADSTCKTEQSSSNGALLLTAYDPDSVMNYCNPRWINDGILSPLDIVGIQKLYGERKAAPAGRLTVIDNLNTAAGQKWEHVIMEFGSNKIRRDFKLDSSTKSVKNSWTFGGSGKYCYKLWSNTLYTDGEYYDGYGEGCWTLEAGKNYTVEIQFNDGTRDKDFDIVLVAPRN